MAGPLAVSWLTARPLRDTATAAGLLGICALALVPVCLLAGLVLPRTVSQAALVFLGYVAPLAAAPYQPDEQKLRAAVAVAGVAAVTVLVLGPLLWRRRFGRGS